MLANSLWTYNYFTNMEVFFLHRWGKPIKSFKTNLGASDFEQINVLQIMYLNCEAMNIDDRIKIFKHDLPQRDVPELVRKYIIAGDCYVLSDDAHFSLRNEVSQHFQISLQEVIVVGSAKLGFSIAPRKLYRHFQDTSDIDIVLCSSSLFDIYWKDVFDYWSRGEHWPMLVDFREYLFRGWMRPDKLPPARTFERGQEWWDFFRQLTASGKYGNFKITGALYKSWRFLECYQQRCVGDCKIKEIGVR